MSTWAGLDAIGLQTAPPDRSGNLEQPEMTLVRSPSNGAESHAVVAQEADELEAHAYPMAVPGPMRRASASAASAAARTSVALPSLARDA